MKFYDNINKRLIYLHDQNTDEFNWNIIWLKHWNIEKKKIINFSPKSLECKITPLYLNPNDGPILEGGCGLGNKVFNLKKLGYEVIGIDNAKDAIKILNRELPQLNVQYGDVRQINFPDNYFSGYWSLGVIEHFYDGYKDIINEIHRVLKSNGILFITFPYMSFFRHFKVKLNLYNKINPNNFKLVPNFQKFYQFALEAEKVKNDIKSLGFKLLYEQEIDGIKGFKEEIFIFKFFIKRFLDLLYIKNKPKILYYFKIILDRLLVKFSAHLKLLVLKKV